MIATAAVQNLLGGDQAMKCCRKAEIVAEAAYAILTRCSRECTGNFFVDDEVLAAEGVRNLDRYVATPGQELPPDLFL